MTRERENRTAMQNDETKVNQNTQSCAQVDRRTMLKAAAGAASGMLVPSAMTPAEATPESDDLTIDGYTGRLSYAAGEPIHLHVSTNAPSYSLEIARVGAERQVVLRQQKLPGALHTVPPNASTHGCKWPVSHTINVPDDWRSGYYSIVLRADGRHGAAAAGEAFFVVRAARPGSKTKILLQLATNTYNAYNDFGGSSLYAGGALPLQGKRVSFERPMSPGFLSRPDRELSRWHPYAGWHQWERSFVAWAERSGYAFDYAVNSDLESRPDLLQHYRLVLSVGHDEYWSAPMRDNLEKFIAAGGNVAFFSGNVSYWQVRSEDDGRALVCYKASYEEDPNFKSGKHKTLATLWSHRLVERPENELTGVSFCYGGYHRFRSAPKGAGAYTIYRPDHWVFAGSGLKWGDELGAEAGVVGYECDGCDYGFKDGLPVPTHADGTPEDFEILALCPASLWDTDVEFHSKALYGEGSGRRRHLGAAVMGAYSRGGTVFTTGCTEWTRGLEKADPEVERITRNVLDRLSVTA